MTPQPTTRALTWTDAVRERNLGKHEIVAAGADERHEVFTAVVHRLAPLVREGFLELGETADGLANAAAAAGLTAEIGEDAVQEILSDGFSIFAPVELNGHRHQAEPPPPSGPGDYGVNGTRQDRAGPAPPINFDGIPLTLAQWFERDLPQPDRILGEFLTTTSRIMLNAATGLGKTNLALAIAGHAAAGKDFLHWRAHRPAHVLFVDGEMSRRLLRKRAEDMVRRAGTSPDNLYLLSHEDVENFQPLNTPAGRAFIEQLVVARRIELVVFDNVMSLVAGDPKSPEGWQQLQPLVTALTKAAVGQFWVHHTGLDTTHGYGDKTKEWRLDTVLQLTENKRADTDVSFTLEFTKARERTPETRRDFESVTIALVDDQWQGSAATEAGQPSRVSPLAGKFLQALLNVLDDDAPLKYGCRSAPTEKWKAECVLLGLIDAQAKAHSARTMFSKYRRELVGANRIGCEGDWTWILT